MPAGKEAQPECISQRASSGRLNCSCSRSRDLTAINPVVPEMMKIAALAVSTAPGGNMSFAFSKSVPIAPAKGRGKRTPAWTNRRAKALVPCGFADAKTAKGILQYQNSRKRLSNCPRIPREEVRKYGSFQSGAKYGIYRYGPVDKSAIGYSLELRPMAFRVLWRLTLGCFWCVRIFTIRFRFNAVAERRQCS